MLKQRLLKKLYSELPCNSRQVSDSFTAFTNVCHGPSPLSWNIRVHLPHDPPDEAFARWQDEHAERLEQYFYNLCELELHGNDSADGVIDYFNAVAQTLTGLSNSLEFKQEGRSGGWLTLERWTTLQDGDEVTFEFAGAEDCKASMEGMSRNNLIAFRKIVKMIDRGCSEEARNRVAEWIMDFYREVYEEEQEEREQELDLAGEQD